MFAFFRLIQRGVQRAHFGLVCDLWSKTVVTVARGFVSQYRSRAHTRESHRGSGLHRPTDICQAFFLTELMCGPSINTPLARLGTRPPAPGRARVWARPRPRVLCVAHV